jgi:hypothetical protein
MEGTKETKDVVRFLCALISTVADAMKDGKVSLSEATSLIPVLMKLPAAIDGIDEIPDEASDFTMEEIEEIKEVIVEDLDLPDDQVEAAVEHLLEMAVKLYALVKMKA